MPAIRFLSWHQDAAVKAALLKRKGLIVDTAPLVRTSAVVGELARSNPAVLVLDLDRLPSNSREIALMLRASKSARHIPILLAGSLPAAEGLPDRYARLKAELPDIPYSTWADIEMTLTALLLQPKTAPSIVPPLRVYTASLAQKLGILTVSSGGAQKPKRVALLAEPDGFVEFLDDLPETVTCTSQLDVTVHLAICFIRARGELAGTLDLLTLRLAATSSVWIAYPKRTNNLRRDFSENDVRAGALAAGLVDYKICSIDQDWSAMKFAWRKLK